MSTKRLGAQSRSNGSSEGDVISWLPVDGSQEERWVGALLTVDLPEQNHFFYVERSYRLFEQARRVPLQPALPDFAALDLVVEVAGATMDFLSSMRTYLAHEERRQRRRQSYEAFRAACVTEYDRSFAYRFLYRLRNYAQHLALPVHEVAMDGDAYELILMRDDLLEDRNVWGAVVGPQLAECDKEIEVVGLVVEAMQCLRRIANTARVIDRPLNYGCAYQLMTLLDHFALNQPGKIPVVLEHWDDIVLQSRVKVRAYELDAIRRAVEHFSEPDGVLHVRIVGAVAEGDSFPSDVESADLEQVFERLKSRHPELHPPRS